MVRVSPSIFFAVAASVTGIVSSFVPQIVTNNVNIEREMRKSVGRSLFMGLGDLPFFASIQPEQKEGTASITTRLPFGSIFDARDYIFSTATNVRGYEWTLKEAEELLDDLTDASMGLFGSSSSYELSQIVLVPMDWDREKYGIGARYDVHDGQQRIVTLCLLVAALRDAFAKDGNMNDTVVELSNMLFPPKTRKEEIMRIELNKRDNILLSHILKNEDEEIGKLEIKKMTRANRRIFDNYKTFVKRTSAMTKKERLKLLDFLVENVHMLVCIPETSTIARSLVMSQGKGKDNEPIDDFKGIVCFRYNKKENDMYRTFDDWDSLASISDLDNGSVGRGTVADACLLRASTEMKNKIRKNDQVYSLERWLRHDVIENNHEGHVFYKKKIEPAALYLGQFRQGEFNLFGFYTRNKGTKAWKSITMRLRFLRDLTRNISSTKEIEMLVLELLLRAGKSNGKEAMILASLDIHLHQVEKLAMLIALTKPSVAERYEKVFSYLDVIEAGNTKTSSISEEDMSSLREALVVSEFGASASGKKIAIALLKRLNEHVLSDDGKNDVPQDSTVAYLEAILPVKGTKKAWGEDWPDQEEHDKWVHRLGNLVLLSNKPTAKESKMAFDDKKSRFRAEIWPITSGVATIDAWNSDNLVKHLATTVALIDKIWGL